MEAHKPQQIPIDSTISFGASTRTYTIREKPQTQGTAGAGENKVGDEEELKGLLGLPEEETELEVIFNVTIHLVHIEGKENFCVIFDALTAQAHKITNKLNIKFEIDLSLWLVPIINVFLIYPLVFCCYLIVI